MGKFKYQLEKKLESEEKIINVLGGKELSFTQLLRLTGLSKPVLSAHMKRMQEDGKVMKIQEKNKRGRYKLVAGALKQGYIRRILFSVLSTQVFDDVFEATGNRVWSDEKFIQRFSGKVGLLALFVLHVGLSIGRSDPEEGGKWIEEAFGTLIQKYAWRRCFFRQILGGEYNLKHPVLLREPVTPEFREKLVRLPEAFVPGVTSKILRQLPEVPENKLEDFKLSLEKVYPADMEKLNDMLSLIKMDVR